MADLGPAIHWRCRDCDFKLDAPNPDAARMAAVAYYIKTGHSDYKLGTSDLLPAEHLNAVPLPFQLAVHVLEAV